MEREGLKDRNTINCERFVRATSTVFLRMMRERDLTTVKAAELSGLSRSAVQKTIYGKKMVNISTILSLIRGIDSTISEVFSSIDNQMREEETSEYLNKYR